MVRVIGLLCAFWLCVVSAARASGGVTWENHEIPEASQVKTWPAPLLWAPPTIGVPAALQSKTAALPSVPLPLIAISPCRMLDTRSSGGPIASGTTRTVTLTGAPCGIPPAAQAVSANFAVFDILGTSSNGVLVVSPAGSTGTSQALVNWGPNTGQVDNASVVPLGTGGAIAVSPNQGGGSIDLVIDVNGYYAPAAPVGTIFNYTGNATVNSSLAISGSTNSAAPNELRSAGPIPVPCHVDAFSVFMDTAPTVLTIFTLQRNINDGTGFLDTNATCQIGVGGTTCQAVSPSVTFAAGDLAMTSVTGAAGAGGRASVSFRCN